MKQPTRRDHASNGPRNVRSTALPTHEAIPVWLNRPVIALDDEKPIELIARGDYKRVARLIAEIKYPGVS
jgi:hypothetical protein